jgi:hypothetical protein
VGGVQNRTVTLPGRAMVAEKPSLPVPVKAVSGTNPVARANTPSAGQVRQWRNKTGLHPASQLLSRITEDGTKREKSCRQTGLRTGLAFALGR